MPLAPPAAYEPAPEAPGPRRSRRGSAAQWTRWLHVYTSMISLLIVLFFGLTGLTLNHPSWTLGSGPSTSSATGTLPAGFASGGNVDFLAVSEFVRSTEHVRGNVADYGATASQGTISYKAPGYAADLTFDVTTGAYQVVVQQQGFLAIMNDLHKGRDTDSSWNWVIDAAALFLVLVALTGLGIQIFQKKRRRRALTVAAAFALVSLILLVIATR
jgi:hypothetical protein